MTRHRGFTLAELLVSIGIIVLFTAFLLPSFNRFGRRNELLQTAQLVQTKILETKSLALAPRSEPAGGLRIEAYEFSAPVTSVNGCSSGLDRFAIVEVTETGRSVVECGSLTSGINFQIPQQTVAFGVVEQGAVTSPGPTGPPRVTYTIIHSKLNSPDNIRTIELRRSTGQVTLP